MTSYRRDINEGPEGGAKMERNKNQIQIGYAYDFTKLSEDMADLVDRFPQLEVTTIGKSVMGKRIPAFRIGTGSAQIHFNGAFHANEWMTSMLLMRFAEDCLLAMQLKKGMFPEEMNLIFQRCTLWIVPMVNPDGVNLSIHGVDEDHPYHDQLLSWNNGKKDFSRWKANIRGVDLNDQFPAHWETERKRRGVLGPASQDYTGEHPLSEPEAQAMARFTRKHHFHAVYAFHSQGEEIYWNYRDMEPDYAERWAEILARAGQYEAVKLSGSDAGYKDWFIQEFRRPGFTVEVGHGRNPLPLRQFPEVYRKVSKIMLRALCMV